MHGVRGCCGTSPDHLRLIAAAARILDWIRAGDIYQANLTFGLAARWSGSAPGLCARLRARQPVSDLIAERLPAGHRFTLVERDDDVPRLGRIFRVTDGPRLETGPVGTVRYPIPYSDSFYADLVAYQSRLEDAEFGRQLTARYMQNQIVVLIERARLRSVHSLPQEVALFNILSLSVLLKDTGLRLLPAAGGREVKVNGPLGIYLFDEATSALAFAQAFRQELAEQDVNCRIGLDGGPVLVFDLAGGGADLAGNPVNIASKMAQDKGRMGGLYLSPAVMEDVRDSGAAASFTELRYNVSGVDMIVYEG